MDIDKGTVIVSILGTSSLICSSVCIFDAIKYNYEKGSHPIMYAIDIFVEGHLGALFGALMPPIAIPTILYYKIYNANE